MNNFKLVFSVFLLSVLLGACGTAAVTTMRDFDRGIESLNAGSLEAAYRFFEDTKGADRLEVKRILSRRPDVMSAGVDTFSSTALKDSIGRYGRETSYKIEKRRLVSIKEFGSPEQIAIVEKSFVDTFGKEVAADLADAVERARVDKLSEAEQSAYWTARHQKWVDSITIYGQITSAQLINESTSGSVAGSQFGAIVGQAAYIDSRNIYTYSAMGQVQAGILGAVLGSILNTSPRTSFRKVYFIKTRDGVKRIDQVDSNQVLFPVGSCIAYREPFAFDLVDENKCR